MQIILQESVGIYNFTIMCVASQLGLPERSKDLPGIHIAAMMMLFIAQSTAKNKIRLKIMLEVKALLYWDPVLLLEVKPEVP